MLTPTYRVVVVEDERLIRDNIVEKIQLCDPSFVVVGAASNGAQALEIIQSQRVDVLFTDIRMPVMDGLELAQQVRSRHARVQVVIVSGYADFAYAQQAIHLGVEEYLLKPVEAELLADALGKLKAKLNEADSRGLFERVRDAINGNLKETQAASGQEYAMFLLNVGNLCSTIASAATRSFYDELWKRFDFAALQALHPGFVLVNTSQPNTGYIVLPTPQASDRLSIGQAFFRELARQADGVSINLLCGSAPRLEALHSQARALSLSLSQNLVMDEPNLIDVDSATPKLPAAILEASVYAKLTTLIRQERTKAIKLEVHGLIESALALKPSQMWMQDFIRQLICLFQRHSVVTSEVEVYHAEYELFDKMALPHSSVTLCDQVWSILAAMLRDTSKEMAASRELIDAIRGYITANFNTDITLEEIARRFHFTPSYLIKIFRKHAGETPIQYVINLRMAEARRLMAVNPELDIKQVGEIVGYADPHYFSRIFKHVNGVTPTEYRGRDDRTVSVS